MIKLVTGIYTRFTELTGELHNSFYIAVGGRLYRELAQQGVTLPYSVYHVIDSVPDFTFSTTLENTRIQFDLISDDEDDVEIEDLYTKLTALYDWATITVSGSQFLYMKRENVRLTREAESGWWVYNIDYSCLMETSG